MKEYVSSIDKFTGSATTAIVQVHNKLDSLNAAMDTHIDEDVIFLKIMILNPRLDTSLAREIAASVGAYGKYYRRDTNLILAMIHAESNFDPNAVSSAGAEGLMQVMPQWKEQLGISGDLKDISVSLTYGLQILAFYDSMYKDLPTVLTAYNRGPGMVDYDLMKERDPVNDYARKVMDTYRSLQALTVGE